MLRIHQAGRAARRLATLAAVMLVGCGGGGGGDGGGGGGGGGGGTPGVTLGAEVYPLASGDRRTWRVTGGPRAGTLRHERVDAAVSLPAGSALPVRSGVALMAYDVEYLQRTATGVVSVPGAGSDALAAALGPVELLRFGITSGQSVVLVDRTVEADINADRRVDSADVRVESLFVGVESVTTAAGTFTGAAHVRTIAHTTVRMAGASASQVITLTVDDWYAPGVGPVRSAISTVINGSAAQTEVEDVIAYGVGNRRSDNTVPSLLSSEPAVGASLSPSAPIDLTFSEVLDPLSLEGQNGVHLVAPSGQTVAVNTTLDADGKRVRLWPNTALGDGRYEVRNGGLAGDLANNPLPAVLGTFVVDTIGPRVVSSSPADGTTDAATTGSIRLSFDEAPVAVPGSPVALRLYKGTAPEAQWLPAEIQGKDVVALLAVPLEINTEYFVEVGSPITDAGGNPPRAQRIRFRTDPGPLARPAPLAPAAEVSAVASADIDGDGRSDLLFAAQQIGNADFFVGVRRQQADGRYAEAVRLHTLANQSLICEIRSLVVADVDADGRKDITLYSQCGMTVLRQRADGTFDTEQPPVDLASWLAYGADLDGDGRAEIATAVLNQFRFMRRDASGNWGTALAVDNGASFVPDWHLADIDGDGHADLVWVRPRADNVTYDLAWALRQGAGFGAVRSRALDLPMDLGPRLAIGDLNGDGRPDIVVLSSRMGGISQVSVLQQDADGGFADPVSHASHYYAAAAVVGDIDGDGRADVVVAHSTLHVLGIYLQDAGGRLQPERRFESGYGYYEQKQALALADLNADGRLDIVLTNSVLLGRPFSGAWPQRVAPDDRATALRDAPASAGRAARRAKALRWLVVPVAAVP